MALIKCPECGKEFSDKAQACPNCGCPTSEVKKQEMKQEEIKEEPEFELQLENDYSIKIVSDTMKLFYQNGFILESEVRGFVLNWLSEEEELGQKQLKIVFSHPGYKKPLKLMVKATSERYEKAHYFVVNIVEKYFKKDICNNYFEAGLYAEKHVDNILFRKAYENEKKIIEGNQQLGRNHCDKTISVSVSECINDKTFYDELSKLDGFDSWGTKKEIRYLKTMLHDSENVLAIASGLMDNNTWLISCTNKRIIFVDCGMLYGVKHSEVMINKINSISFKNGLLLGEIHIEDGATTRIIRNVQKYSTKPFVDAVHKAMKMLDDDRKQVYMEKSNVSAADEILKFKNLLELGVISEEEFETQKNKLLNNVRV